MTLTPSFPTLPRHSFTITRPLLPFSKHTAVAGRSCRAGRFARRPGKSRVHGGRSARGRRWRGEGSGSGGGCALGGYAAGGRWNSKGGGGGRGASCERCKWRWQSLERGGYAGRVGFLWFRFRGVGRCWEHDAAGDVRIRCYRGEYSLLNVRCGGIEAPCAKWERIEDNGGGMGAYFFRLEYG